MAAASPTAAPARWPAVSPVHMLEATWVWIYNNHPNKESPGSARQLKHFDEKTGTTKALETAA